MRRKLLGRKSIWLALMAGLVLAGVAQAQDLNPLPQGKQKNGLSMAIYPVAPRQRRGPETRFTVVMKNVGRSELALNLGTSLGNSKTLYRDKVVLILGDEDKSRTLIVRQTGVVAGRVDPLVVRLAPGATYSFPVNLDDYWVSPSDNFSTRLRPGYYAIEARFTGVPTSQPVPASVINGRSLPPYWTGTLKSKKLRFVVGSGYPYGYGYGYGPPRRFYGYGPYGPYAYPPYPPPPPPPPPARNQQQDQPQDQGQQQQDQAQPQDQDQSQQNQQQDQQRQQDQQQSQDQQQPQQNQPPPQQQ